MLNICVEYGLNFDKKFNQSKSFLFQIGLDINEVLPDLYLCGVALKWVKYLKYIGVWLSVGKRFTVDLSLNCTKFVGSIISLLQKSASLSEEIKWHLIQHSSIQFNSIYFAFKCRSKQVTNIAISKLAS